MIRFSTACFLFACMLAWIVLLGGFVSVAPYIESYLYPPLLNIKILNVTRNEDTVCWDASFFKQRPAVLQSVHFWIEYANGSRDDIKATLNGKLFPPIETIPPSINMMLKTFCAELPILNGHITVDLSEGQSWLTGRLVYKTNLFWNVVEKLPSFVIPKNDDLVYEVPRKRKN